MKKLMRILGPVAIVAALSACAASNDQSAGASSGQHAKTCRVGGTQCRWDNQCCSGRCYVDVGCSG